MSRSGYCEYSDDDDLAALNLYRANVDRALAGKRGQAFLRELVAALDALPEKKLIAKSFANSEGVCALGAVARARGITEKVAGIDASSHRSYVARLFGIARCMACEIMFENDEGNMYWRADENEGYRWERVRRWAEGRIVTKEGELT